MAVVIAPKAPMLFIGLSTDTKPLPQPLTPTTAATSLANQAGVPNGAVFYATDTLAWYIYDGSGLGWISTSSAAMA
jgi:hypothetical protein